MALLFDANSEQVDHGSGTTLDSIAAGTVIYVYRPSAVSGNQHLFRKEGTDFSRLLVTSSGNLELGIERSGVDCVAITNTAPVAANVWQAVVATWDTGGANGDQHIYHGNLSTGTLTEPTSVPFGLRTRSFSESRAWVFVHRRRIWSCEPSPFGENVRPDPPGPRLSPTRPAFTRVLLGGRTGTTWVTLDDATAIQTPRSTNDTGPHSRTGWVTSYQVQPSSSTPPLVNATTVPAGIVPSLTEPVPGPAR